MQEAQRGELVVEMGVEVAAVVAVLRYLYTGVLKVAPEHGTDVLQLAHFYGMRGLTRAVTGLIESFFDFDDLDNLLSLTDMALRYGATQ